MNIAFLSLVSKLATLTLPCRQINIGDTCWMKFSFIRKTSLGVQDIWKDGDFSKWLLLPFDQKSFQELVFKAFKNRKRSGYVDRQQVRSIDWNLFFFTLKLLNCEWSQKRKTKAPDEFIFVVFRLFVLLPNSMSKLIHNRCKCKLIIKTTAGYVYANDCNCVCVFMF